MADLQVLAPLRIESFAYGGADTIIGAGRDRARRAGSKLAARLDERTAVALVGVAGALAPQLVPGDLIIASELRSTESTTSRNLPAAALLAAEFKRSRVAAHTGPVVTSTEVRARPINAASSPTRARWRSIWSPRGSWTTFRTILWPSCARSRTPLPVDRCAEGCAPSDRCRSTRGPLERWARACGQHEIVLASPRSFCAGVERAIETVERAIEQFGAPVYVRRQIVHNLHVVRSLERRGAIFVEEIEEVPDGAVVVLAAHGVSPEVRRQVTERSSLHVIDATCPLVTKVHTEARRYARGTTTWC